MTASSALSAVAAPMRLSKLIDALLDDAAKIAGDKVLIVADGKATDAATGAEPPPGSVEDVVNNNRMRRELEAAKAALDCSSTAFACATTPSPNSDGRRRQAAAGRPRTSPKKPSLR